MTNSNAKIEALLDRHMKSWNSNDPDGVAKSYAPDTSFIMNRGDPLLNRDDISAMAGGFMREFPDMVLHLDSMRCAKDHVIYLWTFEGRHSETGNPVKFSGWEEWDLNAKLEVVQSLGWYDVEDYERQTSGQVYG